jgi:hypothetical protein
MSIYTGDDLLAAEERERARAAEHDRDEFLVAVAKADHPHTLTRIVHAQFQAFMLEFALAQEYIKEGLPEHIDIESLALKCEAFCDSLAMLQVERVTSLAAD